MKNSIQKIGKAIVINGISNFNIITDDFSGKLYYKSINNTIWNLIDDEFISYNDNNITISLPLNKENEITIGSDIYEINQFFDLGKNFNFVQLMIGGGDMSLPQNFGNYLQAWWDFTEQSLVTKSYQNLAFTVSGTSGTKTLTASSGIAGTQLSNGMKILLNDSDIYTVSTAGGTTITIVENLSTNYTTASIAVDRVSMFKDKSPYARHLTQSTSSIAPIYIPQSRSRLAFRNNAYFNFNTLNLTSEYTIMAVVQSEVFNNSRFIIGSGSSSNNNKLGIASPGNLFTRIINSGASDSSLTFPAGNNIIIFKRNRYDKIDAAFNSNEYTRLFSDSAQSGTFSCSTVGIDDATTSGDWNGYMSEIIIINEEISESDKQSILQYFYNKYN